MRLLFRSSDQLVHGWVYGGELCFHFVYRGRLFDRAIFEFMCYQTELYDGYCFYKINLWTNDMC